MQAIIRLGGKQYIVKDQDIIKISRIDDQKKDFKAEVLAVMDGEKTQFGTPLLNDSGITVELIAHSKSPKLYIHKYKSKVQYRRRTGHRDDISIVKIKFNQ